MYQLLINVIFYVGLYFLVLILLTIDSTLVIWLIIERIVFITIPLILKSRKPSLNSESVIIYFIYQALASILIITGFINYYIDITPFTFLLGIFIKLGMFPFHLWVIPVLTGCSYRIIFTLLVPVKIPMYLLSDCKRGLLIPVRIFRMVTGIVLAINQTRLLKVIIGSRIGSSGILVSRFQVNIFRLYFLIYSITLLTFLYRLYIFNTTLTFVRLLSFLGVPLFPLFIPKLLLLRKFIEVPFFSGFLLLTFAVSSLYYVKFLPSLAGGEIKWKWIVIFLPASFLPYLL